jgi:hypothetical protein
MVKDRPGAAPSDKTPHERFAELGGKLMWIPRTEMESLKKPRTRPRKASKEATVDERLRHVTSRVERAKQHIGDLERHLHAFLGTNPYGVACKVDPHTRKPVYPFSCVHPIPESLPLVAGDAIQNLMSALDHLTYQLVCSDTGDKPKNPRWIYFPIRDSFEKYEADRRGKMQGAHVDTISAIDALKPYKGGNDPLWSLYALNVVEKHRLLLTVGSQAAGVHLGELCAMHSDGFPPEAIAAFRSMDLYLMPADKGFPLKEGFELYIGGVDEEPNPNLKFRFTVALDEPEIVEGQPLLETLHQLTALVEGIVTALTPRLQ